MSAYNPPDKNTSIFNPTNYTTTTTSATATVNESDATTKNNFIYICRDGSQNLGSVQFAYPLYNSTVLTNTNLFSVGGNSNITVLKAGYYKLDSYSSFELAGTATVSYAIRKGIIVNNNIGNKFGVGYTSLRHNLYGSHGTITLNSIILLAENDVIRVEYSCAVGDNNAGFGSNFGGNVFCLHQGLTIAYIGV